MSKKRHKPLNDKALAEKYACNPRTIRRWRKDGAPVNDDVHMSAWLATRRNIPRGTMPRLTIPPGQPPASIPGATQPLPRGVGPALQRLEGAEADAFRAMEQAMAGGDQLLIRSAREHWLKISSELRRYDLIVEATRRQGTEMIAKSTVEQWLRTISWLWQCAHSRASEPLAYDLSTRCCNDPRAALGLIQEVNLSRWLGTMGVLNVAMGESGPVPKWALEALVSAQPNGNPGGLAEKYRAAFEQIWITFSHAAEAHSIEAALADILEDKPSQPEAPDAKS